MKKLLSITLLVLLSGACSDDAEILQLFDATDVSECEIVATCFDSCNDRSCLLACSEGHRAEDLSKAAQVNNCIEVAAQSCYTEDCIEKACSDFIDICSGDVEFSCGKVVECSVQCNGDLKCSELCDGASSPEAELFIEDIQDCAEKCSKIAGCNALDYCAAEATACVAN